MDQLNLCYPLDLLSDTVDTALIPAFSRRIEVSPVKEFAHYPPHHVVGLLTIYSGSNLNHWNHFSYW